MIFSADRILRLTPSADQKIVEPFAEALEEYAERYGLTTRLRRAHFIAQAAHESAGFTRMVENLNYSAERIKEVWSHKPEIVARAHDLARNPPALANAVYANRFGNGDEASRDGWRYRGRGPFQLTFCDNYRDRGTSIGVDLVLQPDRAAEPALGAQIALDYWRSRACSAAAETDSVAAVTKLINGGSEGLAARQRLTDRAKTIFLDADPAIA